MTFAPKSGFPFDPLAEDKPASNLYTGVFGNHKDLAESDAAFAPIKSVDALIAEIQELRSGVEFDFDSTVKLIARGALDFFSGSGVAIAIEQNSRILCCASAGETAPDVGTELNVAAGISGVCFRTGQSQYCHDAKRDERVDFESCQALGILSILISPILMDGRTIGLVEVFSPEEFFFDRNDISSLERIASLVAQSYLGKPAAPGKNQNGNAPKAAGTSAITSSGTLSSPTEVLSAAAPAKAGSTTASPAMAYSPAQPANFVVPATELNPTTSTRSPSSISQRASIIPVRDSKPEAAYTYKSLLLAVSVLAVLIGGGLGTRALLREKPNTQTAPIAATKAPAVSPLATSDGATLGKGAPSTSAAVIPAASATAKPAEKKPAMLDAVAPRRPKAGSSPEVMDLRASASTSSSRPQNGADLIAEAPSLGSVGGNTSSINLASTILPGAASVPRLNHTSVIEPETLIHKVNPVYPPMARSAHVVGEVVVRLTIGKDGIVKNATIEKGPPMLRAAVVDAVKQWKYKPYKLDGDPREVEALVSVKFQ